MVALGCDPAGYTLKCGIMKYLMENGIEYKDHGCFEGEACDYPLIARTVCNEVAAKKADLAILCCGTGIGISMAANKVKGIRAAACSDYYSAKYTRVHNDANVLCLGGRVIAPEYACELVNVFLNTEFEGGRHQRRVDQITAIENGEEPHC